MVLTQTGFGYTIPWFWLRRALGIFREHNCFLTKKRENKEQGQVWGRTTMTVCECKIQTQPSSKPDMVKPVS